MEERVQAVTAGEESEVTGRFHHIQRSPQATHTLETSPAGSGSASSLGVSFDSTEGTGLSPPGENGHL